LGKKRKREAAPEGTYFFFVVFLPDSFAAFFVFLAVFLVAFFVAMSEVTPLRDQPK
jgi:hypothetical protein